ncbi:hypothetical protein NA57DRAFT_38273 [Rhizodiscina lignyota]|uniref:pH-response regulator protein palC n=1 Tax=Rhizodiscina lignyota TaxID=1504668 RepID=A0A9P4IHJ9_9PEZI|nr:hypothetical protein NA57DRAFT_38273 [Rhizodiscina lignyota]
MPFPFTLPTTSSISFPDFFSSSTHPSLPLTATSRRAVLRSALKSHKRLPSSSRASNLPSILAALNDYIPYLFALDAGVSGIPVAGEEIDVVLVKELQVEWRVVLSATTPGRESPRVKLKSLDSEVFFVLSTLGYTYCLLARAQLHTLALQNASSTSTEQRAGAIAGAMKNLIAANSVFTYLVARSQHNQPPASVPDISQAVLSGLASMTLAEATLITVLKDDPYPAVVSEQRNKESKDWMFKNPDIPKVRAHLFARLCLAAAEHASRAQGMLGNGGGTKVDADLLEYCDDLKRTAKAKACRFFGIDTELEGKTGEGIAWLRGAKKELGFTGGSDEDKRKFGAFSKLKKDWAEKREDKRIEKGGEWGGDAGRFEEGRVIEMLEKKWVKENDTVNVQLIPQYEPLVANMPSGREYHTPKPYQAPTLDEDIIAQMRAPPDPNDIAYQTVDDDSDAEESQSEPVGAFPGTKDQYSASTSSYY